MNKLKTFWQLLRDAGTGFRHHKILKLSASLAYYTIFSIGPMLLVIIFCSNLFWGKDAIEGRIFTQISGMIGKESAIQVQEIIKKAAVSGSSFSAIIGLVILIVAATTVFIEMQDSINMIWNLKVKKTTGWWLTIKNRLLSFSIVAGLGFFLLVTLVLDALLDGFMSKLQELFPKITVIVIYVLNIFLTLVTSAALFAVIFKVLPDACIKWKDVIVGAFFTAVLFIFGKFCISYYIKKSNLDSAYGAAGSIVVLLLWIYISSVILYFGAEFTKVYALKFGSDIFPDKYAVMIRINSVESSETSIQQNEQKSRLEQAHNK